MNYTTKITLAIGLGVCAATSRAEYAKFVAISNEQQVVNLYIQLPTNDTAWALQCCYHIPEKWVYAGNADPNAYYNHFRLIKARPFDADWKERYWALRTATDELDPVFARWDDYKDDEKWFYSDPIRCLRMYREKYLELKNMP